MQEFIIHLFENLGVWAIIVSLLLNVGISILGIVPSVFITAANILVFGLPLGITASIVGEALGAIVSFYLYRMGIQKFKKPYTGKNAALQKLEYAKGWQAFWLILSLRILPFVPSGAVTLISAMSRVSIITFAVASTIGKIPALFIEAFSIYGVLAIDMNITLLFTLLGSALLLIWFMKTNKH